MVQDPEDFADRRVDVLVRIHRAHDVEWVEQDMTRGVACRYRFYTDAKKRTTREVFRSPTAEFGYSKQFTIRTCSPTFVNYLKTNSLVLELWGKQGDGTVHLSPHHTIGGLLNSSFRKTLRHVLSSPDTSVSSSSPAQSPTGRKHRRRSHSLGSPAKPHGLSDIQEEAGEMEGARRGKVKGKGGPKKGTGAGAKTKANGKSKSKAAGVHGKKGKKASTGNASVGDGGGDGDDGDDGDDDDDDEVDLEATRALERQMDEVVMEAEWLEERRRLQATIEELQQEVDFLQIEKGQLEKEMS